MTLQKKSPKPTTSTTKSSPKKNFPTISCYTFNTKYFPFNYMMAFKLFKIEEKKFPEKIIKRTVKKAKDWTSSHAPLLFIPLDVSYDKEKKEKKYKQRLLDIVCTYVKRVFVLVSFILSWILSRKRFWFVLVSLSGELVNLKRWLDLSQMLSVDLF